MDYCSTCRRTLNGALICPGCGELSSFPPSRAERPATGGRRKAAPEPPPSPVFGHIANPYADPEPEPEADAREPAAEAGSGAPRHAAPVSQTPPTPADPAPSRPYADEAPGREPTARRDAPAGDPAHTPPRAEPDREEPRTVPDLRTAFPYPGPDPELRRTALAEDSSPVRPYAAADLGPGPRAATAHEDSPPTTAFPTAEGDDHTEPRPAGYGHQPRDAGHEPEPVQGTLVGPGHGGDPLTGDASYPRGLRPAVAGQYPAPAPDLGPERSPAADDETSKLPVVRADAAGGVAGGHPDDPAGSGHPDDFDDTDDDRAPAGRHAATRRRGRRFLIATALGIVVLAVAVAEVGDVVMPRSESSDSGGDTEAGNTPEEEGEDGQQDRSPAGQNAGDSASPGDTSVPSPPGESPGSGSPSPDAGESSQDDTESGRPSASQEEEETEASTPEGTPPSAAPGDQAPTTSPSGSAEPTGPSPSGPDPSPSPSPTDEEDDEETCFLFFCS